MGLPRGRAPPIRDALEDRHQRSSRSVRRLHRTRSISAATSRHPADALARPHPPDADTLGEVAPAVPEPPVGAVESIWKAISASPPWVPSPDGRFETDDAVTSPSRTLPERSRSPATGAVRLPM